MSRDQKVDRVGESLILIGSEFHRVGAEREKERRPEQDFIVGTDSRLASEERRSREGE